MQWCRDRLLVPGQPLTASVLFVEPADRDSLLALKALSAELARLNDATLDPSVMATKAGWWRQALAEGADHPALLAMIESGAVERVRPVELTPLLELILDESQAPRFERYEELWSHCHAIGGEAARLEAALCSGWTEADNRPAAVLGGAGYLLRLVRDLGSDADMNRWRVPLDLQAQFQVARSDAVSATVGPGWDGLVRTLVERAVRAGNLAAEALSHRQRHLHLQWALDRRLAAKLVRNPKRILKQRILTGHAGNVWTAWRAARRLRG